MVPSESVFTGVVPEKSESSNLKTIFSGAVQGHSPQSSITAHFDEG